MATIVLNTKIGEVENKISDNSKYITIQEFNKLAAEMITASKRRKITASWFNEQNWFQ